ncbi:MAG: PemK family transcriptional regulator [SAR86 cluster bacterium]|uniref:PemK family transcriptional regulator n=1 Tax=SAR86 cluster bacterium TaxID=2030880 RepID=A0A2A5ACU3_9GAMM|nr:MAG: PemK family transcriptional regulator [SAR86 cluster bacterium]
MYIPDQGDIVSLDFDPSTGKEIMKRRPAFILSKRVFNDTAGFAVVAPITSTKQSMNLCVELPDGLSTAGTVLIHQLKLVDFTARNVEFVESVPAPTCTKAIQFAALIVS